MSNSDVHPANFWPRGPGGRFLPRGSNKPPSSHDVMMAAMADNPPQPAQFPDEPEVTATVQPEPKPMVSKAMAAGAPPVAEAIGAGVGFGTVAAEAGIAGVEAFGEAAKSPQGSISAFLPGGGGGGGGQDYAGQALSRAILAALNRAGNIATRY